MAEFSVDFQLKSSITTVWSALTDSTILEKWIWKNDFKPSVGHTFKFQAEPNEWWDGVVTGEVLVVDEPNTLSYTWGTGSEVHTVKWTLASTGVGTTQLHLDQTGISERPGALEGAKSGQIELVGKLEKVLADM